MQNSSGFAHSFFAKIKKCVISNKENKKKIFLNAIFTFLKLKKIKNLLLYPFSLAAANQYLHS